MAQASALERPVGLPSWKQFMASACAVLLSLAFLVSGIWKLVDPLGTEARMVQALVWPKLALATALGVGLAEAWTGVLLLVPNWRRWGALLAGFLLVAFMIYMGVNYTALQGEDCSCFPWLKRVVGPGFFVGDGIMLAMALLAGLWANPAGSASKAFISLVALLVFSGVMVGAALFQQTGLKSPDTVVVAGKEFSLRHGKVLLYFYDPMCAHCFRVAKEMSAYHWAEDVRIVSVPIAVPQYAEGFLEDTGLLGKARTTLDAAKLRGVFKFGDPPYAVALEHGRQRQAFAVFEDERYAKGLAALGFILK